MREQGFKDFEEYKKFYKEKKIVIVDDIFLLRSYDRFYRIRWMKKIIEKNKGKSVLDVGCHRGLASIFLAMEGFKVTGIDISPVSIRSGRKLCKKYNIDYRFVESSFEEFKKKRKFDYVIAMELIEHVLDPNKLLDFCEEHCNKIIFITTPDYYGQFGISDKGNDAHIRAYKENELKKLIEERGKIIDFDNRTDLLHIAYKPKKI